jgi:hypothetical protein
MPWADLDTALIEKISEVLTLRSRHPALSHGEFEILAADETTLVLLKDHPAGAVLVGVNTSDTERTLNFALPGGKAADGPFSGLVGAALPRRVDAGRLSWQLPPYATALVALDAGAVAGESDAH